MAYQAIKGKVGKISESILSIKSTLLRDASSQKVRILIVNELNFVYNDVPVIQVESGIAFLSQRIEHREKKTGSLFKGLW